jgi:hypothetical protein
VTRRVRNALLLLGALSVFVSSGLLWGFTKSDWAAWVQAIGSIAAIVGSVWAVQRQLAFNRAEDRERERREGLRKYGIAAHLAIEAAGTIQTMGKLVDLTDRHIEWKQVAERLGDCKAAIQSIPLLELPEYELAPRLQELLMVVHHAREIADGLADKRVQPAEMLPLIRHWEGKASKVAMWCGRRMGERITPADRDRYNQLMEEERELREQAHDAPATSQPDS